MIGRERQARDAKENFRESSVQNLLEAGRAVVADIFNFQGIPPPALDNHLLLVAGPGTRFVGPGHTLAGAFRG